jgi:hypothetical protein
MLITPDAPAHGAAGTCAVRSAAIRVHHSIWLDHGRTMDRTRAVHPSGRSLSGVITWEKLSARKMASGSCKAAMTAMLFGRARDRLPVPSHSGTHMQRSKRWLCAESSWHVMCFFRTDRLAARRNAIRLGGYPGKPPSRSTPGTKVPFTCCDMTGSRISEGRRMGARLICVLVVLLGLSPNAMAAERGGLMHRPVLRGCPILRRALATAAEQYARSRGATDSDIEAARRCIKPETSRTASAQ